MGITTDDPQSIIRLGTIHSWLFKGSLWAMPLIGGWMITTILRHDTELAVLKVQMAMVSTGGGKGSVSQSVNVGKAAEPEAELVKTSRDYITTADIAAREKVSERAVLEWISAGRIQPQPVKNGKAWTIAKNFRILPNDAEKCGETPQD